VLSVGSTFAERFVVDGLAGQGGMGAIYDARDACSGERVALKVALGGTDVARFLQEAELLARFTHPCLVRHVAHGVAEGTPYLAMEWLDGKTFTDTLTRGAVDVAGSLTVVRRVAAALSVLHANGVVHRDVKPDNILLLGEDPERAMLLDLGVARTLTLTRALTGSNAVIGTVGYMAPEQASGSGAVDARADVFALGCVLFEALTGRPAFEGRTPVAVLAKLLMESAPRVRTLRPQIPEDLDALVAQMLAKSASERPSDASAVLRLLDALGETRIAAPKATLRRAITTEEQRLACVILVQSPATTAAATADTQRWGGLDSVDRVAHRFHAVATPLAAGAILITVGGSGVATDRAVAAADCALALRDLLEGSRIAIGTGMVKDGPVVIGPVIDRAAELVQERGPAGIRVDEVTARLLDARFELMTEAGLTTVVGRATSSYGARTLLGRPMPFVGREREMAHVLATVDQTMSECAAKILLVVAPPGAGKSRLRNELAERLLRGGEVTLVSGRAEPLRSPFALGRQLVRDRLPRDASYDALAEHVKSLPALARTPQAGEFLGELCGIPSPLTPSVALQAARANGELMASWTARCFVEWLGALAAKGPTVALLEDLHWADAPSVVHILEALTAHADRPLLVLAFARPKVRETYPELYRVPAFEEMPLAPLGKRASERLAEAVLGPSATPSDVTRIVDRAGGNAFFLEELLRFVAESRTGALPDTVLAMLHSRIDQLDLETRQVLRAASILGERAHADAITHLIGKGEGEADAHLEELLRRDMLETVRGRPRMYAFRHALLREAAYATLTETDRRLGHRLAADRLELEPEPDPFLVASHLDAAGEHERCLAWSLRAARVAIERDDAGAVLRLSARALEMGAAGEVRGELRAFEAVAAFYSEDPARAHAAAVDALRLCPETSESWVLASGPSVYTAASTRDSETAIDVVRAILESPVPLKPTRALGVVSLLLTMGTIQSGRPDLAAAILARLDEARAHATKGDAAFDLWRKIAHGVLGSYTRDDVSQTVAHLEAAEALATETGDRVALAYLAILRALGDSLVGGEAAAERADAAAALVAHSSIAIMLPWAQLPTALARVRHDPERAMAIATDISESQNVMVAYIAHAVCEDARSYLDPADARDRARAIVASPETPPPAAALAWRVVAATTLRLGDARAAADAVEEGARFAAIAAARYIALELDVLRVECALALGDAEGVQRALALAQTRADRMLEGAAQGASVRRWAGILRLAELREVA
jgi:hypothetical protein